MQGLFRICSHSTSVMRKPFPGSFRLIYHLLPTGSRRQCFQSCVFVILFMRSPNRAPALHTPPPPSDVLKLVHHVADADGKRLVGNRLKCLLVYHDVTASHHVHQRHDIIFHLILYFHHHLKAWIGTLCKFLRCYWYGEWIQNSFRCDVALAVFEAECEHTLIGHVSVKLLS